MSAPGISRLTSVVTLSAAAAATLAPAAGADMRDPNPVRLVPDKSVSSGGATTQSLPVPQRYLCSGSGTLRNVPDSFVMGWCLNGWPIDLQRSGSTAYQGWAYGNYDGCGWIYAMHIGSAQPGYGHSCTSSTPESSFMLRKNASPGDDGAPVTVKAGGCRAYLNTRPWAAGSATNEVGGIPEGQTVYWRYLTRNDQYVLLRRTNDSTYPWVFVPKACVPEPASTVGPAS